MHIIESKGKRMPSNAIYHGKQLNSGTTALFSCIWSIRNGSISAFRISIQYSNVRRTFTPIQLHAFFWRYFAVRKASKYSGVGLIMHNKDEAGINNETTKMWSTNRYFSSDDGTALRREGEEMRVCAAHFEVHAVVPKCRRSGTPIISFSRFTVCASWHIFAGITEHMNNECCAIKISRILVADYRGLES